MEAATAGSRPLQVARGQCTAFFLPVDPVGDEIQVLGLAITMFFLFRFGHVRGRRRQIVYYFRQGGAGLFCVGVASSGGIRRDPPMTCCSDGGLSKYE